MIESRMLAVDVEGNGGNPPEIVELAIVELKALSPTSKTHHWLLRPTQPISAAVTRIHGITNADVQDAPSVEDIDDAVLGALNGAAIVGHNVRIEVEVLSRQFPSWKSQQAFDTLLLARRLLPGLASYSLGAVGKELKLLEQAASMTSASHHSALFDATLSALIFSKLLSPLSNEDQALIIREIDILDPRQGSLF